ncbi:hypothetical protein [Myxacorys almedinensis]|uniref:Uncharacterized protein n=1 Tax=Myxacorys almedinensis A TaxID=2690445 RepID=A0A8J7Z3H7_9CYAN|nr:hypothetical protein [Myxacorys almedinensis]NDJ15823.1 hypothetical protein [Myxacorys almedinensis A]
MIKRRLSLPILSLLGMGLIACSQSPDTGSSQPSASVSASPTASMTAPPLSSPGNTAADGDLTQLFSRVWRVTQAPSNPASGSIYVFLPSGTLLQTSCVEPYRISGWTVDKNAPRVLRVTEDGQLAFTAAIAELNNTTLRLQQTLVRSNERRDLTLAAVEQEFVCPDLPR